MKNILILCILFACVLTTGCAQTMVSGTFRTLDVPAEVGMSPIAADLRVSEQRTQGVAQGKVRDSAFLYDEALSNALGQNPPRPEGPDILVAGDLYAERKGSKITLTITGYPAWYHNFRTVELDENIGGDSAFLLIPGRLASGGRTRGVMPSLTTLGGMLTERSQEQQREQREKQKSSFYFTPRWNMGGAFRGFGWWAFDAEFGFMRPSGFFMSIDGGFGRHPDFEVYEEYEWDESYGNTYGGTFNIGREFDLGNGLQLAVGGSLGFWRTEYNVVNGKMDDQYDKYGIAGPFVRLSWNNIEIMYRGLFGWYDDEYIDDYNLEGNYDGGGIYTSQLMLGYRFGGKRNRQ